MESEKCSNDVGSTACRQNRVLSGLGPPKLNAEDLVRREVPCDPLHSVNAIFHIIRSEQAEIRVDA